MKSKARAMTTTPPIMMREWGSGILEDDRFKDVGDILATIGGRLEHLEDFLFLDQLDGIFLAVEEPGHRLPKRLVRLVFQTVDLDALGKDHLRLLHVAH